MDSNQTFFLAGLMGIVISAVTYYAITHEVARATNFLNRKIEALMSTVDDIQALVTAQGTVITEIVTDTNAMLEIIAGAGTDAEKLAQVKATLEANNAKLVEVAGKYTPTTVEPPATEPDPTLPIEGQPEEDQA